MDLRQKEEEREHYSVLLRGHYNSNVSASYERQKVRQLFDSQEEHLLVGSLDIKFIKSNFYKLVKRCLKREEQTVDVLVVE